MPDKLTYPCGTEAMVGDRLRNTRNETVIVIQVCDDELHVAYFTDDCDWIMHFSIETIIEEHFKFLSRSPEQKRVEELEAEVEQCYLMMDRVLCIAHSAFNTSGYKIKLIIETVKIPVEVSDGCQKGSGR